MASDNKSGSDAQSGAESKWAETDQRKKDQPHKDPSDDAEGQSFGYAIVARQPSVNATKQKSQNGHAVEKRKRPRHGRGNIRADPVTERGLKTVVRLKRRQQTGPRFGIHEQRVDTVRAVPATTDFQIHPFTVIGHVAHISQERWPLPQIRAGRSIELQLSFRRIRPFEFPRAPSVHSRFAAPNSLDRPRANSSRAVPNNAGRDH